MNETVYTVGDTAPPLSGTLSSDETGVAVLTGASLSLHLIRPDGTTVIKVANIVGALLGTWNYVLAVGDLSQAGTWGVAIVVTWSDLTQTTFRETNFTVLPAV